MEIYKAAATPAFNENAILAPFSSRIVTGSGYTEPVSKNTPAPVSLPLSAERTVGLDVLSVNVAAIGAAIAPNRQRLTIGGKGKIEP